MPATTRTGRVLKNANIHLEDLLNLLIRAVRYFYIQTFSQLYSGLSLSIPKESSINSILI